MPSLWIEDGMAERLKRNVVQGGAYQQRVLDKQHQLKSVMDSRMS
jgi:hypothetical protein